MTPAKSVEADDCVRTCVAMMLDVPVIWVPHIFANSHTPAVEGWAELERWLNNHGYGSVHFAFGMPLLDVLNMMEANNPNAYYILLAGNDYGNHAVVCRGRHVVADPNWNNKGVSGQLDTGDIHVMFLVPLAMTKQ